MRRIKASIMALIIAVVTLFHVHKPADHEKVSESPTESKAPVIPPVVDKAPEPSPSPPPIITEPAVEPIVEPPIDKPETIEVISTFYVSDCKGCSGITASGYDVRHTIYYGEYRIIAADRDVALGTKVYVELADGQAFKAIVLDRGGSIKGARIDVLVASYDEAIRLGRQQAKVTILND